MDFGNIHTPSGVVGPKGVGDSSGALLDRMCFAWAVDPVLVLRLWPASLPCALGFFFWGFDNRLDNFSKVSIASIRDVFDRFTSAW